MNILVENSQILRLFYSKVDEDQKSFLIIFKEKEDELEEKLSEINRLKLILNNEELDKEINDYNESLKKFTLKVKDFNLK